MIDLEARPEDVARQLLGACLRHETADGVVEVVVTEVEAYAGAEDPASHAFRGPTARNAIMYGPAGHLYVYRSMGLHWCANIVTGTEGQASAVLLRAGRVTHGGELARQRRGSRIADRDLARGPGRLCEALGITGENYGADLFGAGPLHLHPLAEPIASARIDSGPRVGVSKAPDVPWRFWISGEPTVSPYRRSTRAEPVGSAHSQRAR